jgi:hypothetical protein
LAKLGTGLGATVAVKVTEALTVELLPALLLATVVVVLALLTTWFRMELVLLM